MQLTISTTLLCCPDTGAPLEQEGLWLLAPQGQRFPIVHGIPVLLAPNENPTLWVATASRHKALTTPEDPFQLHTIGLTSNEVAALEQRLQAHQKQPEPIDPVVSFLIGATNGHMYDQLRGNLLQIPIPRLRLPHAQGELLLDVGCNWGRWCIAAARAGYRVVGIDPSLGAVLAGQRLAQQLGLADRIQFICADALQLPLAANTLDQVFSYSVLQHFSRAECTTALREMARVSKSGGHLLVQLPNRFGIRSAFHILKRRLREPIAFEVRYYSPAQLKRLVQTTYGSPTLEVDCFFGLGIQPSDLPLMPWPKRLVIYASELLRALSQRVLPLALVADSLYLRAKKIRN